MALRGLGLSHLWNDDNNLNNNLNGQIALYFLRVDFPLRKKIIKYINSIRTKLSLLIIKIVRKNNK